MSSPNLAIDLRTTAVIGPGILVETTGGVATDDARVFANGAGVTGGTARQLAMVVRLGGFGQSGLAVNNGVGCAGRIVESLAATLGLPSLPNRELRPAHAGARYHRLDRASEPRPVPDGMRAVGLWYDGSAHHTRGMSDIPLAPLLAQLLDGHGVEAVVHDDAVYLPRLDRWANLWMHQTSERMHLLEVVATADDEVTITDRCAGIGDTVESAKADGVQAFCAGTFHVLLAALWGVLERDQVDHEILFVEHREWDVYMGPCTTRISAGVQALVLPPALPDLVQRQWKVTLLDRRVHTARLFLAVVNGAVTVEAMIDDQPDAAMAEVFRSADWALPETGFASLRWFLAACPRTAGPTHAVERASCSG